MASININKRGWTNKQAKQTNNDWKHADQYWFLG